MIRQQNWNGTKFQFQALQTVQDMWECIARMLILPLCIICTAVLHFEVHAMLHTSGYQVLSAVKCLLTRGQQDNQPGPIFSIFSWFTVDLTNSTISLHFSPPGWQSPAPLKHHWTSPTFQLPRREACHLLTSGPATKLKGGKFWTFQVLFSFPARQR